MKRSIVCIAEDRPNALVGVALLLDTLHFNSGIINQIRVNLYIPLPQSQVEALIGVSRLSRPYINLVTTIASHAKRWHVKPHLLLQCLKTAEEVLWIDSDIIVSGAISSIFPGVLPLGDLLIAEEPRISQHRGGNERTKAWGFPIGRSLPFSVNSGVLRCTRAHSVLLDRWGACLKNPKYLAEQSKPTMSRRMHLLSDQEVLSALLGSVEFQSTDLRYIRADSQIIQLYGAAGYTPLGRIMNSMSNAHPLFIHAMGKKPWEYRETPSLLKTPRRYYDALVAELSTYTLFVGGVSTFRENLAPDWSSRKSIAGWLLRNVALRNPNLAALPLAIVEAAVRRIKRSLGMGRIPI